jgi:hypothetical protein
MNAGLTNASKSSLVKYALACLAGIPRHEARKLAMPSQKSNFTTGNWAVDSIVPENIVTKAVEKVPDNQGTAYVVRYAIALENDLTEEEARAYAHMPRGRPRKNETVQ